MELDNIDFKIVFQAMPGNSALIDINAPTFTILAATNDYLALAQPSEKLIIGKGIFEVFRKSPNDPDFTGEKNLKASFEKVIAKKTIDQLPVQRYDVPDQNGNFQELYWQATNKPVFDSSGNVRYIIHSAENITDKIIAGQQKEKIKGYQQAYNLFMQAPVGICILKGRDFVIELANDPFLFILQKDKSIISKTILEVLPEIESQGLIELLQNVMATGEGYSADEAPVLLHKNGKDETVYFNYAYQPYYEEYSTEPVGVLVFCTDVTEKIIAVRKSHESENLNRVLIEESTVAIAMYSGSSLKIQYANDVMLQYWGKDQSVIGMTLEEAVPELKGQPYLGYLSEVYKTGVPHIGTEDRAELFIDGKLQSFYFDYTYKALKDSDGKVYGIHHMAIDVTEQISTKLALQQSDEKFKAAVAAVEGIVWTNSADGRMLGEQPAWSKLTGQQQHEYEGFGWASAVHPDDAKTSVDVWNEAVSQQKVFVWQHRVRKQNGEYGHFSIRAVPLFHQDGTIREWVGVHTDITEQLITQEALRESEKRLERLVEERTKELTAAKSDLEKQNLNLEQMNKELESFAYISSHDLQEPLRKIQTFASRIMETDHHRLSDNGRTYFERIQNAGLRMQTLIDDLLTYSRTNTEARNFEQISLHEIIDEIKEELSEDLEVYKATIETIDICDVHIISFQFRQLMHNLIGNALKFSKHDRTPHIVIRCETHYGKKLHKDLIPDKKYCHITISDNGIGFEPEYGERIFEVFQRLHGRDKYRGTGIGLAIVKKIIENHEGIITATGELHQGAKFDIYIPSINELVIL